MEIAAAKGVGGGGGGGGRGKAGAGAVVEGSPGVVCSSAADDYPALHVVFDFFTDNPQKMPPPPPPPMNGGAGGGGGSASGSQREENPFFDPYWESIRSMQENELFLEGTLLKSVDCKRKPPPPYLLTYVPSYLPTY